MTGRDREELRAWLAHNAVRTDHLGPCAGCGRPVNAGDECSTCLEDHGRVVHDDCGPQGPAQ